MAPHVQAAVGAAQAKESASRLKASQRKPPADPRPAPCRPGAVQRASLTTYQKLYSNEQPEYPALRFHKNRDWKKALEEEGEFRGDAYALRDPDYDPLLRHPLGKHVLESRRMGPWFPHEDYGEHGGYNASLAATVERAIHRSIMEHSENLHVQGRTVADLVQQLLDSGPLLVVDVGSSAGNERYNSPTMGHKSFGKVGKQVFKAKQVLTDIPLITEAVLENLQDMMSVTLDNESLPKVREILIGEALRNVSNFLETRYGLPNTKPRLQQIPQQVNNSNVALHFEYDESLLDDLLDDDEVPGYLQDWV